MTMAFASLSMPPMEEAMEMSSPAAGQQFDGDIDIDFDDYTGADHTNDDEYMLEDGDPMRPGTAATDDLMADVDHPNVTSAPTIVEEEMQDSDDAAQPAEQHMNDEELIDYEDEVYPDQPQEALVGTDLQFQEQTQTEPDALAASSAESSLLTPAKPPTEHVQVDEEIVRMPEDAAVEELSAPQADMTKAAGITTAVAADSADDLPANNHTDAETFHQVREGTPQQSSDELARKAVTEEVAPGFDNFNVVEDSAAAEEREHSHTAESGCEQDVGDVAQKLPPQHLGTIDVSGSFVTDGPPTPTDRTLHTMSIQFGDYKWPLFKSRSQPDGLLKDDNLLNVSLTDLLHNLSERLALKVNEEDMITEAQELVLNFDIFGLMVAESSLHASATSLNDVLAVYLNLHENDGIPEHDTPPLSMTLTTQLNFSTSIASLKQLAESGAGLPSIVDNGDDDATEVSHEENADDEHWTESSAQQEVDDASDDQEQNQTENRAEAEANVTGQAYEHHEDDGSHRHEDGADEHQNAQDLENGNEGLNQDPIAADLPLESSRSEEEATKDASNSDVLATQTEEVTEPKSGASSPVVRASAADSTTELHDDGGEGDFSALLDEDQTEQADEASNGYATADEYENDAGAEHNQYGVELENDDFLDEDYLQDQVDAVEDQLDEAGQQQYTPIIDAADSSINHDNSQVDKIISVSNENPPDAEDKEPFETAFDLLDDDGKEPFDDNDEAAKTTHQAQDLNYNEDDIGFDLDDDELAPVSTATSTPRHGKRPLEEPEEDEDHIDFDEPELKKVRAD